MRTDGDPGITLTLYVRTPVAGARTETVDRLGALEAGGEIEAFEIHTVREEVIVSQGGTDGGTGAPGSLEALLEWETAGITPTFGVEEAWTRTGRTVRKFSPPETVLAVYTGGTLACVFPCTDGDRTWTVADFFDGYEEHGEAPADLDVDLNV